MWMGGGDFIFFQEGWNRILEKERFFFLFSDRIDIDFLK